MYGKAGNDGVKRKIVMTEIVKGLGKKRNFRNFKNAMDKTA